MQELSSSQARELLHQGPEGQKPSYSGRGRREGTACADLSLAALSAFPACCHPSFPPCVTLPLSRPSILPPGHPSIRPSSSLLSVLSLLAAPAFSHGSFAAVCHPGPPSRGRASTPVSSAAPARQFFPGALLWRPSRDSFRRVFPEHCSRPACLPQSFSPPVTRLPCRLTLAIPARGFFPWMSS